MSVPLGYTLTARRKSIAIGPVSGFWHMPARKPTLLAPICLVLFCQVRRQIVAPGTDGPDKDLPPVLVHTVQHHIIPGDILPHTPPCPRLHMIGLVLERESGELFLNLKFQPKIPLLSQIWIMKLGRNIVRLFLNVLYGAFGVDNLILRYLCRGRTVLSCGGQARPGCIPGPPQYRLRFGAAWHLPPGRSYFPRF